MKSIQTNKLAGVLATGLSVLGLGAVVQAAPATAAAPSAKAATTSTSSKMGTSSKMASGAKMGTSSKMGSGVKMSSGAKMASGAKMGSGVKMSSGSKMASSSKMSSSKMHTASTMAISRREADRIALRSIKGGRVVGDEGIRSGAHVVDVRKGRAHYRVYVGTRTGRIVRTQRTSRA